MSQFVTAVTQVRDAESIIAALQEMGVSRDKIEVYLDQPKELSGYDASDRRLAEIIVRKADIGAYYGDVGATRFSREGKKGEFFEFITDDMDCSAQDDQGMCHGRVDRRTNARVGGFVNQLSARANAISLERNSSLRRSWRHRDREIVRDENGNITEVRLRLGRKPRQVVRN